MTIYGYLAVWNTTSVPSGSYTLQSLVTDNAGHTAYSAGITVTVDNTPPTTAVIIPSNGATVSGTAATLDATASASYGVGITKVQFVLTGGAYNKTVIGTAGAHALRVPLRVEHDHRSGRELHPAEPGHRRRREHHVQRAHHG